MTLDDHLEETWPRNEAVMAEKPPAADALTAFLYLLMRDHLPIGTLTAILSDIEINPAAFVLTNGPLAVLARDLAGRLR